MKKVIRHPKVSNDFNVKGVEFEVVKEGKVVFSYIGDGKQERFIPLPKGMSLFPPYKIKEK